VSDLAGRANIVYRLKQQGLGDQLDDAARRSLLERIKCMEHEGYDLEAADGTFELLVRTAVHPERRLFDVESYEVAINAGDDEALETKATVTLRVNDQLHSASANGHGPLHALHSCLRTCLRTPYPRIKDVRLADYKVRVLDACQGTAAKVRVLMEWTDNGDKWSTVGVSDNVVQASWKALLDSVRLELMRSTEKDRAFESSLQVR
jgi:2-isopropylmalate synthase